MYSTLWNTELLGGLSNATFIIEQVFAYFLTLMLDIKYLGLRIFCIVPPGVYIIHEASPLT